MHPISSVVSQLLTFGKSNEKPYMYTVGFSLLHSSFDRSTSFEIKLACILLKIGYDKHCLIDCGSVMLHYNQILTPTTNLVEMYMISSQSV